jgi:hypothetical protein
LVGEEEERRWKIRRRWSINALLTITIGLDGKPREAEDKYTRALLQYPKRRENAAL